MNKKTTWRRVLSVLCVAVMLLGMTFAGVISASAAETAVAKIGDTEYTSLQAAINAAAEGDTTITLLANVSESVTVNQAAGKNITIDGNGKTITGKLTINGKGRSTGKETLTFNNVTFARTSKQSIVGSNSVHNVTFNGCNFVITAGYFMEPGVNYNLSFINCNVSGTGAFMQAKSATNNLYVENLVAENTGNLFKIDYCSTTGVTATFKNVEVKTGVVAFYISDRNSGPVNFENVNATCQYPVYIWARGEASSVPVTLNFSGENTLASTDDGRNWLTGSEDNYNLSGQETVNRVDPMASINGVEYATIQEAINAANDGDTVVVIADHTMNMIDRDHFIGVENNKSITLDLNGKTVTADATDIMQATDHIRVIHVLEGSSLVIEDSVGTGKVVAYGENSKLAYMLSNSGNLLVNGGNFELSAVSGGAMFWSTNANMTIAGGNFVQNTKGWMFNALHNGVFTITVNGGTYNRDFLNPVEIAANDWTENIWGEAVVAEGYKLVGNGNGTWSVVEEATPVAKIGDVEYTTLQDAIAAAQDGDTIVLVDNIVTDGSDVINAGQYNYSTLYFIDNKALTIDFNGYTIDVTANADVNLTTVQGVKYIISIFYVYGGANVTFTGNGGIVSHEGANGVYCFIYNSNGSTVTVENGTYNAEIVGDSMIYADKVNNTYIKGGNFHVGNFDINKPWVSNVSGKNAGNFVVYTGGTFNHDPLVNFGTAKDCEVEVPAGYTVVDNGDGTWTIVNVAAKIGDVYYTTLAEAIAAVQNGETIVLVADNAEKVTIKQVTGKSFTIDGAGFTFSGTITINGNKSSDGKDTITFQNINFNVGSAASIDTVKNTYAHNVTIDNCTFTGNDEGIAITLRHAYNIVVKNTVADGIGELLYAQNAVTGLTVENVEVKNCIAIAYLSYGINVSFNNVVSTGTTGRYSVLYKNNSGKYTLTFNNCQLDAYIALEVSNKANVVTVALNGTTFTSENWINISKSGATVKVTGDVLALDGAEYDAAYYTALAGENLYVFTTVAPVFKSSNLNLGNSFGIYFNVDSETLVAGVDYVAVITDANGKVVAEITSEKWIEGRRILFSGLAAKQMSDEFTAVIMSAGEAVTAPVTESIKSYVERGRAQNLLDAETLDLLTAMLNYGAAAQESFNYNEGNLANTVVADREVVDVDIVNNTNADSSYYGASLNLNSNICFNFKFLKDEVSGNVVKAYVKYVDKNGENVCEVCIPVYEETTTKFPKDLYVVKFDTIIPEDAAQVFTCELIDENGNVVATAQDSILSYCARAIEGLKAMDDVDYNGRNFQIKFYQAVANYIVAVSNYNK